METITLQRNNQKILLLLKQSKEKDLSITNLVEESRLSRSKIRIILAQLEGAGKVKVRRVGMAKLYSTTHD